MKGIRLAGVITLLKAKAIAFSTVAVIALKSQNNRTFSSQSNRTFKN
jgi:hypothetical protein